ncbi:hypothetical protein NHQ30_007647 [Ciborinia camelliae]|nr:hypothetical protein NHQ30_007647 [Ciborinia camelliae]
MLLHWVLGNQEVFDCQVAVWTSGNPEEESVYDSETSEDKTSEDGSVAENTPTAKGKHTVDDKGASEDEGYSQSNRDHSQENRGYQSQPVVLTQRDFQYLVNMERIDLETPHSPFPILVQEESTRTTWLDHVLVDELLQHTSYPEFRQTINKALEHGRITSSSIASNVTCIFGMQEGYQLGGNLEHHTISSLILLRWLLIGYGSSSTQEFFTDSCMKVLNESELLTKGPGQNVYVEHDKLYLRKTERNEWLEELQVHVGRLKYWLEVVGEQLIFNQRWGLPKKWVWDNSISAEVWPRRGHWEGSWTTGALEKLVVQLWEVKSNVELKLVEAGQRTDYILQYRDMMYGEDGNDGGDQKVLKFWPQNGKKEWVSPTKVTAEEVRLSAGRFLNVISNRKKNAAGQGPAPQILPNRSTTDQTDKDIASRVHSYRYRAGEDAIPQLRLNGFLLEQDTASQIFTDRLSTDKTDQHTTPQMRPDQYITDQDTESQTRLDGSLTGQDMALQSPSEQLPHDQIGQDTTTQIQTDRSTTGQDAAPQLKSGTPATGQGSTLQVNAGRIPTGQDTAPQVKPDQYTTVQDTVRQTKTNKLAIDHESALRVRQSEPTTWYWGREKLTTSEDTAPTQSSRYWYSARKSPDTPNAIEFPVVSPLLDGTSMNPARTNLYSMAPTAPPTRPLPPLPQDKADENELAPRVEGLSAEERSDLLISNYAEALLAKHRKQPKEVYPVEDGDSDLDGERPLCGCEVESLSNEAQEKLDAGTHTTDRDSNTLSSAKGDTTKDEVDTEEPNSGHDTSNNRPCIHIDMADVGERLAVLDAAELGAMEEREEQEKRSQAEQTLLDLPERDRRLEEELKHSADIKDELLGKLESDTPLVSKIKAVEIFFEAVAEETEKVQGWTEELREAEAEIDRGYDGDWEETPSEEKHANEQMHVNEQHGTLRATTETLPPQAKKNEQDMSLDDWNNRSDAGSDMSDYTRAGPSSPVEEKMTQEVYTAEEYKIPAPPTGN